MQVDAETWADLISMTKAGVMTWQTTAEKHGRADQFSIQTGTKDGRSVILTRHMLSGREQKAKCIMRFDDTGSVFPCKFDRKEGKWVSKPAPQSWVKAQGKSVETLWKIFNLTDFFMVVSSEVTKSRTFADA